ncbi:MAG: hypothetical protein J7L20_03720 [Thermoplasmata archaeon]|nr:hypothetical protein [Thermoplasmata archaeon]
MRVRILFDEFFDKKFKVARISTYVLAGGDMLVKPSAIAYASALDFHDLTTQVCYTMYIQTTTPVRVREFAIGVRYRIVTVKPEKFFGLQTFITKDGMFRVTDPEKTIIDCLDKPIYGGGMDIIIEALEEYGTEEYDKEKLVRYALRMKSQSLIARLGYLCDYLGIDIEVPEPKLKGYVPLVPYLPKEGRRIRKWKIIDNYFPLFE